MNELISIENKRFSMHMYNETKFAYAHKMNVKGSIFTCAWMTTVQY
jgi:hypothetical protein